MAGSSRALYLLAGMVLLLALGGCSQTRSPDSENDRGRGGIRPFTAVTFNTGTSENLPHDRPPDDGYTSKHAAISDEWYGDGLAWTKAVDAVQRFFEDTDPDVVVFQEIFWPEDCPGIPEEARKDFVCETWTQGDPTVAERVLGQGWQVMCHPGKPDKCAAVNRRFGTFRGCDRDFCLEGMEGTRIEGCGDGARVARGVIDLKGGGSLALVNVHGSSGFQRDDRLCRTRQIEKVFVDMGDGEPAANAMYNLVMGDLNTDPIRLSFFDESAALWSEFVGPDKPFHFVSDVGWDAVPTYAHLVNIDHVVSNAFEGTCWVAGISEGHPPVTDAVYFDHHPVVCKLELPAS